MNQAQSNGLQNRTGIVSEPRNTSAHATPELPKFSSVRRRSFLAVDAERTLRQHQQQRLQYESRQRQRQRVIREIFLIILVTALCICATRYLDSVDLQQRQLMERSR